MGVRPTQLTENRKNRLAKLFRILTCQVCRPDTHALPMKNKVIRFEILAEDEWQAKLNEMLQM